MKPASDALFRLHGVSRCLVLHPCDVLFTFTPTQKERHQDVLVTDGMTQFERRTARSAHPQLHQGYQCSGWFLFVFEGQVSRMSAMNASTIKENLLTHQSARSSCPSPTSHRGRRKNIFAARSACPSSQSQATLWEAILTSALIRLELRKHVSRGVELEQAQELPCCSRPDVWVVPFGRRLPLLLTQRSPHDPELDPRCCAEASDRGRYSPAPVRLREVPHWFLQSTASPRAASRH